MKSNQARIAFDPGNGWLLRTGGEGQNAIIAGPLYLNNGREVQVVAQHDPETGTYNAIVRSFEDWRTLGVFTISRAKPSTGRREAHIVLPRIGRFNAVFTKEETSAGKTCMRVRIPSLFSESRQIH